SGTIGHCGPSRKGSEGLTVVGKFAQGGLVAGGVAEDNRYQPSPLVFLPPRDSGGPKGGKVVEAINGCSLGNLSCLGIDSCSDIAGRPPPRDGGGWLFFSAHVATPAIDSGPSWSIWRIASCPTLVRRIQSGARLPNRSISHQAAVTGKRRFAALQQFLSLLRAFKRHIFSCLCAEPENISINVLKLHLVRPGVIFWFLSDFDPAAAVQVKQRIIVQSNPDPDTRPVFGALHQHDTTAVPGDRANDATLPASPFKGEPQRLGIESDAALEITHRQNRNCAFDLAFRLAHVSGSRTSYSRECNFCRRKPILACSG